MKKQTEVLFSEEFLVGMQQALLARKESKLKILKEGGLRAKTHSPRDIVRIDFALMRMKDGQYGLCTKCGCPIAKERLEFMPETPFCSSCQPEVEKQSTDRARH